MVRLRRSAAALARELDASPASCKMPLRYGENPHQAAALYVPVGPARAGHRPGRAGAGQGAQLQQSQRRQCRARARRRVPRRPADDRHRQARQSVRRRERATRCVDAWTEALACDSVSAFGGIVAANRPLDAATAEAISADLHRSRGRARCRRGRQGDLRQQEESAPAADRRAARPGARRPDACGDRRRAARPGPRQRHRHSRPAQAA